MQSKAQEDLEFLREQLKKNDLANVEFDIDFGNIGNNPEGEELPPNFQEIQDYLKNDILKSDLQHLNDLTAFFFDEEHKKKVDCVETVEVLIKLDETGVFGYPKLFELMKFNVKEFVVNYLAQKKLKGITPEELSGLILTIAKTLLEKC